LFSISVTRRWRDRRNARKGERGGRHFLNGAADFESQRLAGEPFERRGVTRRRPELELGVASGANLQEIVVAAVVKLHAADALGVAAVEAFGEAQNGGERTNGPALPAFEIGEAFVAPLRRRLPVIPGDQRDALDFVRLEAAQMAVADQIVRVLVMLLVADVDADVVQDGCVLEPFALAIGEPVDRAGLIEQRDRQPRHLL
jgi:hypothetical protein